MKIVISEEQLRLIFDNLISEQRYDRDYVDFLLDKIKAKGIKSLDEKEKDYLDRVSRGEDIEDELEDELDYDDEEEDGEEEDDSDLPEMFRSKFKQEPTGTPDFSRKAEKLIDELIKKDLLSIDDIDFISDNEFAVYGLNHEMNELFDGHFNVSVRGFPNKFIMTMSNDNITVRNYFKISNYIKKEWPKVIDNLVVILG